MKRVKTIETTDVVAKPTTSKKSKYRTKAKQFGPLGWSGKTNTGFPKSMKFKHRFVTWATLTSTAGSLANYRMSCNGLFDPDLTSAGKQPLYFDQLAAIYNHYTVTKSKITIRGIAGYAQTDPMLLGVFINDDTTTTPTTADPLAEQSTAAYTFIGTQDGGRSISKKWDAKNAFGPNVVGDNALQGTSAANPTEQQVFNIFAVSTIATPSAMTVNVLITVEYETVWQELKDIAPS